MRDFIKPDDMHVGYGILVHSEGWIAKAIQKFTKSYWNHVAVSLGGYDIVEATPLGVKLHDLRSCYYKDGFEIKVFTVKGATRVQEIKAALFAATKCNLFYDFMQITLMGICLKFGRPKWAKFLNRVINKISNSYICSEVYYNGWLMVGEVLYQDKDISEVSPADLDPARNPLLREVLTWKP